MCEEFDEILDGKYQEYVSKREIVTDPKTKNNRTIIKQKKITSETPVRELLQKLRHNLKTLQP